MWVLRVDCLYKMNNYVIETIRNNLKFICVILLAFNRLVYKVETVITLYDTVSAECHNSGSKLAFFNLGLS